MEQFLLIAKSWLQPEARSVTEVVEWVAMDKFLRGLPDDVRWLVGMRKAKSPWYLIFALETALVTQEMGPAEHPGACEQAYAHQARSF